MNFGWSVGDLIQGANLAWQIYESFGRGENSAKKGFLSFRAEFNLVKCALKKLHDLARNCPDEDLDLGEGYEQTLQRCAKFIQRHKRLATEAEQRRPSLPDRILSVWERVSWPAEREDAERLRRYLERYVQFAILKVTVNNRDATWRLSEQARADHLEILRAVRTMSVQVSSILRSCVPDGAADALDVKYLARLQRRHPTLLDPTPGLNAIPEDDTLAQSDSKAALQRIHEITDRLEHLALRLDTIGRKPTPSPERIDPSRRTHTGDSVDSDITVVAPVIDLLNHIGDEVRKALDKVGYGPVVVPSQQQSIGFNQEPERSSKVLSDAAEDWDQFRDWLQFRLLHPLEGPPHIDLWSASAEPSPRAETPSFDVSRHAADSPSQRTLSPPRAPVIDDETAMSRTSSYDSNYPHSPASVDSTWGRRSSIPLRPLTEHPVQVLFPDRIIKDSYVHPPITCQIAVSLDPKTNGRDVIEGTDPERGIQLVHSLIQKRPSSRTESSMVPYLQYTRHSSAASNPLSIRFMGSAHQVEIAQNGTTDRLRVAPVYVCHNKQDLDMFQSILLRRYVLFCGDTKRIHSSSMGDHCSQETVRVLRDPLTGTLTILYFASNRGLSNYPARFMDIPVSDFSSPQREGKREIRLPLAGTRRNSLGLLPRRNSVESSLTATSQESRASRESAVSSVAPDNLWKKEKWLQFDFVTEEANENDTGLKGAGIDELEFQHGNFLVNKRAVDNGFWWDVQNKSVHATAISLPTATWTASVSMRGLWLLHRSPVTRAAANIKVKFNSRVIAADSNFSGNVQLEDGPWESGDIVIAADGTQV
ncbi:hypothetical protein BDW71DRAFT_202120 [Aspergillus fruticulosus]